MRPKLVSLNGIGSEVRKLVLASLPQLQDVLRPTFAHRVAGRIIGAGRRTS